MAYIADGVLLQLIGAIVVAFGAGFVFFPESTRDVVQRLLKKTNDQYKFKGIIFILIGAAIFYLGVN